MSAYDQQLAEAYDHRERVATFTVVEGGTLERFGLITLTARWDLAPAPAPAPLGRAHADTDRRRDHGRAPRRGGPPRGRAGIDPRARWPRVSPGVAREVDFVTAFERPGAPRGAAALVADAIARSRGKSDRQPRDNQDGQTADVSPLAEAASARACLAIADSSSRLERWVAARPRRPRPGDRHGRRARVRWRTECRVARVRPCVGAPRGLVLRAGGLDARRLHVGDALDLALRVIEAGGPVECLAIDGPIRQRRLSDAPPGVTEFLAWRNAAILALERPDSGRGRAAVGVGGRAGARAAPGTRRDSTQACCGSAATGPGGRVQDRWLGRAGIRRNDVFWPKNGAGTAIPYLALDAALDEFHRAATRRRGRLDPRKHSQGNDDLVSGARGAGLRTRSRPRPPAPP